MVRKVTIYSAVLAVVFAAVGCLGDNIDSLYSICMGLCIASLIVFIAGLFRMEFVSEKKESDRVTGKEKESFRQVA